MKSRIGTINRKPIVQGDKNLVTPNEIHVSELEGGGGEQSDIPVEYYKVVALEGEDLNEARVRVLFGIAGPISVGISNFHVLIKGTSSIDDYKLFTGLSLSIAINNENYDKMSVHAYSIRAFQIITKAVSNDGTIREIPSFNNIFDAADLVEWLPEEISSSYLRKHLVPITAEEFCNLDDLS